jgi:hypothetical protein
MMQMICDSIGVTPVFYGPASPLDNAIHNEKADLAVIYLPNRNARELMYFSNLVNDAAAIPTFALLDDWWQGHRGDLINAGIQPFYWFEVYKLWKQIQSRRSADASEIPAATQQDSGIARYPVFYFSNTSGLRCSFCEVCSSIGCTGVAFDTRQQLPTGTPRFVIWHLDAAVENTDLALQFLSKLVIAYPNCLKFLALDFPRFDAAEFFLNNGIDFVIGAPYDFLSVLATSDRFSSAALRRR